MISLQGGSSYLFYKNGTETSKNITPFDLGIYMSAKCNIVIYFNSYDKNIEKLELAKGTLNIAELSIPTPSTADDFIEIHENYVVDGSESYVCTVKVLKYDLGLDGEVYIYIGDNIAYYNNFTGDDIFTSTIYGKNLTGNYNGNYTVKVVYKRLYDKSEYSKQVNSTFINVVGIDSIQKINVTIAVNESTKTTQQNSTVSKANVIVLTLKKVTVKRSAKKLTLQATLKINGKTVKGKLLSFKFNKKPYNAKTNSKGIAKVAVTKYVLKKLKVGKKN